MKLPNVEGIVIAALKADTDTNTATGGRVVSDLPATKTWPAVRVTRFGGPVAVERVLDQARLQIDVFATTKQAAFDLTAGVRAVCEDMPGKHRLGTVTGVDIDSLAYMPDETFDPAIPRYVLDVTVWAKPNATT